MDAELLTMRPAYSRLADYFGIWSMEEVRFQGLFNLIAGTELSTHADQFKAGHAEEMEKARQKATEQRMSLLNAVMSDGGYYTTPGGIALIEIRGTMMKAESSWGDSASTVQIRQQVRAAGRDPSVVGAVGIFDTPGGTVAGTQDLASEWAKLETMKPTSGFIEDLCASAGYWCVSQLGQVICNPTALVGSIGTYMSVRDTSAAADAMKVKVHVIKAGEFKGAGTPGTPITDAQLAKWQEMVNSLNQHFLQGVASGRRMSLEQVQGIADGSVLVGEAAKSAGLVDSIGSLDDAIRSVMDRAGQRGGSKLKGTKMTDASLKPAEAGAALLQPTSATLEQLEANCPGADNDFLMKQLRGKVTVDQAKNNWLVEMNRRLAATQKELADAKAIGGKPVGQEPLRAGRPPKDGKEPESFEDPVQGFLDLVAKVKTASPNISNSAAIVQAGKRNPALHRAYVIGTQTRKGAVRQLEEKYDE